VQHKRALFSVPSEGYETNGRFEYVAIVAELHATLFVAVDGNLDVGDAERDTVSLKPRLLLVQSKCRTVGKREFGIFSGPSAESGPNDSIAPSLTSLREKLIKIGAKVVSRGRYIAFQMAEVAIPRHVFAELLRLIADLRSPPTCVPT